MAIRAEEIYDMVETHCLRIGYFDRVNRHEPKNAPGRGLTCAIWLEKIDPARTSGLNSTSIRLEFMIRVYSNMLQEPVDMVDPEILKAVDALMEAYSGDFELAGETMAVDLLGMEGQPLSGQSGYLNIDNKVYRVMTIRLPLIIDNLWTQES